MSVAKMKSRHITAIFFLSSCALAIWEARGAWDWLWSVKPEPVVRVVEVPKYIQAPLPGAGTSTTRESAREVLREWDAIDLASCADSNTVVSRLCFSVLAEKADIDDNKKNQKAAYDLGLNSRIYADQAAVRERTKHLLRMAGISMDADGKLKIREDLEGREVSTARENLAKAKRAWK